MHCYTRCHSHCRSPRRARGLIYELVDNALFERMMKAENTPKAYQGKEYTAYEAKQRQRQLETTMRAQRQKIGLLEEGGADPNDIIDARARYRVTSQEYTGLSKAMGIPQQRERVTIDSLGGIGKGTYAPSLKKEKLFLDVDPS